MGRGKIEIKRIENATNRQVTFSKRRNGIFKKAQELTILCDAKVSLIMFSKTDKIYEYISSNTTTKEIFDEYQKTLRTDLWATRYERMQNHLKKLRDDNNKLRRDIRQRMGEDLNDISIEDLRQLQQSITSALDIIRPRKYHVLETRRTTCNKKVKNLELVNRELLLQLEERCGEAPYGLVDNEGDYKSVIALANGGPNIYGYHGHPNLHHGGGADGGFGLHHLRLV